MPRRSPIRQPVASSAVAASATPVKRNSIGSRLLSAAYLSRNAMPKNNTTMPIRTTVLPPSSQSRAVLNTRSTISGGCGATGAPALISFVVPTDAMPATISASASCGSGADSLTCGGGVVRVGALTGRDISGEAAGCVGVEGGITAGFPLLETSSVSPRNCWTSRRSAAMSSSMRSTRAVKLPSSGMDFGSGRSSEVLSHRNTSPRAPPSITPSSASLTTDSRSRPTIAPNTRPMIAKTMIIISLLYGDGVTR